MHETLQQIAAHRVGRHRHRFAALPLLPCASAPPLAMQLASLWMRPTWAAPTPQFLAVPTLPPTTQCSQHRHTTIAIIVVHVLLALTLQQMPFFIGIARCLFTSLQPRLIHSVIITGTITTLTSQVSHSW